MIPNPVIVPRGDNPSNVFVKKNFFFEILSAHLKKNLISIIKLDIFQISMMLTRIHFFSYTADQAAACAKHAGYAQGQYDPVYIAQDLLCSFY